MKGGVPCVCMTVCVLSRGLKSVYNYSLDLRNYGKNEGSKA